jgi:hypothetical protein
MPSATNRTLHPHRSGTVTAQDAPSASERDRTPVQVSTDLRGREHAGGSAGVLPRTRRRSVHGSRNLSRAPAASLVIGCAAPGQNPVTAWFGSYRVRGRGLGQDGARPGCRKQAGRWRWPLSSWPGPISPAASRSSPAACPGSGRNQGSGKPCRAFGVHAQHRRRFPAHGVSHRRRWRAGRNGEALCRLIVAAGSAGAVMMIPGSATPRGSARSRRNVPRSSPGSEPALERLLSAGKAGAGIPGIREI